MHVKKRGAFFTMDATLYIIVLILLLCGGFGMMGYNQYAKYRDSVLRSQVDAIDTALIKYSTFHRGVDKSVYKYDSSKDRFSLERPPIYPSTLDELKADRDYSTGWFDSNTIYVNDSAEQEEKLQNPDTFRKPGVIHYAAYDEDGNLVSGDTPAFEFDLWVELSTEDPYYSHNSKATREKTATDSGNTDGT